MRPSGGCRLSDVAAVAALLRDAARAGEPWSYAGLMAALGERFTRPRMRALCRTLDAIDETAIAAGQSALAVLVVRAADGLPGQGWWVGRGAGLDDWTGTAARRHVAALQQLAVAYWQQRPA